MYVRRVVNHHPCQPAGSDRQEAAPAPGSGQSGTAPALAWMKRPIWSGGRRVLAARGVETGMMKTHKLDVGNAEIVYDVRGPLPAADGRPPLFMIGQPMDASGFTALASHLPDRTVVTYDPQGLGRSSRRDGRVD